MATNGNAEKQKSTAEQYRELLATDPKLALELSIGETERAKLRLTESREVRLDKNGNFQVRTLNGLLTLGRLFSHSGLVPERFQSNAVIKGKDNGDKTNDCAIGIAIAMRLNTDPLLVLQNMFVVYGRPGFEAKFLIAVMNASPKIKGRVWFDLGGEGETRYCVASAIDAETAQIHSQRVDMAMAEAEGWTRDRNGMVSKWVTMPDVMLQYRSAAFLSRIDFPDVVMGLYTLDELEDISGAIIPADTGAATGMVQTEAAEVIRKLGGSHVVGPVPIDTGDGGQVMGSRDEFEQWLREKRAAAAPGEFEEWLQMKRAHAAAQQVDTAFAAPVVPVETKPVESEPAEKKPAKKKPEETKPAEPEAVKLEKPKEVAAVAVDSFINRIKDATTSNGIVKVVSEATVAAQKGLISADDLTAVRAAAAAKG